MTEMPLFSDEVETPDTPSVGNGDAGKTVNEKAARVQEAIAVLDEINSAISSYDDVLREKACEILLNIAFEDRAGTPPPVADIASAPDAAAVGSTPLLDSAVDDFATLIEKAPPKTNAERVLLGAYYLAKSGEVNLKSQSINTVLKDHGLVVTHISDILQGLINTNPQLILQVKKTGSTKQARKIYKITTAGIKEVEARLTGAATGGG